MAKQSSVNLDITNNADGFDISGGTTVRKLGITGGDVTIAGSGSATVTFPTTSTTIAGLGITQSFSALQSFSAGISAAGGVTLAGTLQGTTANFTGLVSSTIGFSGPATNLSGSATGLTAGTATNVIITDNNGIAEQYLTFVTGTGGTGLRIDKTSTPLTYTPSASKLKLGTSPNFLSLTPSYIETGGPFSIVGAGGLYFEDYSLLSFGDVNQEQSKMLFEVLPTNATKYARLYIPGYASNATLLVNRLTPVGTHAFEVNRSDGKAAKLIYGDTDGTASNYVDLDVSSGGNLTITPSGSLVTITGRLDVSAGISAAGGVTFSGNISAPNIVNSFNGSTGAVQGVSAAVGSTYLSVSGSTGSVTFTNTGVQTFNGLTGAVTGVTVGGTNVFTALNTFNAGISAAGSTFSGNVNLQDNTLSRIELLDYCERFVDLGDFASKGSPISIDLSTGQVFRTKYTLAGTGISVTNVPDNANANTVGFTLLFVGDGTARTMTWNIGSTAIGWAGGIAPTYTSTLNKIDVYSFLTRDGGSNWLGFVGGQNF